MTSLSTTLTAVMGESNKRVVMMRIKEGHGLRGNHTPAQICMAAQQRLCARGTRGVNSTHHSFFLLSTEPPWCARVSIRAWLSRGATDSPLGIITLLSAPRERPRGGTMWHVTIVHPESPQDRVVQALPCPNPTRLFRLPSHLITKGSRTGSPHQSITRQLTSVNHSVH